MEHTSALMHVMATVLWEITFKLEN